MKIFALPVILGITFWLICSFKFVQEKPGNQPVTVEMLNCKSGMYKTYQDFVNQTPQPWKFKAPEASAAFGKLVKYEAVFIDEKGQKVRVSTSDFWGYKLDGGKLARTIPFVTGSVKAALAGVEIVTKDYVFYEAEDLGPGMSIEPPVWYSTTLADDAQGIKDNFKQPKTKIGMVYKKLNEAKGSCMRSSCPDYRSATPSEACINGYYNCVSNIPDVVAVWNGLYNNLLKNHDTSKYVGK
ncbi:MAG TPA: hypothetical protein VG603_04180 [Chitinophagales bacterium]|nr:hypothetical protein [Chitinophagales bacterium]